MNYIKLTIKFCFDVLSIPFLVFLSVFSRFVNRKFDIGLGPEPIISNVYNKKALLKKGYKVETFVSSVFYITDHFDYIADRELNRVLRIFKWHILYCRSILRYKCLYIFFNGGPLQGTAFLWIFEPYLLKIAGIKVVVMPYGGDVQDLTHCSNLAFINAISLDYPLFKNKRKRIQRQIDLWTFTADYIISGCDWVDYLYHWDTLVLNYFSIDLNAWYPVPLENQNKTITVLHSPNHREIKGTVFFENAVKKLKNEGLDVELVIIEKSSNQEVKAAIEKADIVADQLIIGWYAMFAIEGMALGKPVLCYLRSDLEAFYTQVGLIEKNEIPLVNCNHLDVVDKLRNLVVDASLRNEIGLKSREYVKKYHSYDFIGSTFDKINKKINLDPSALKDI